MRFRSELFGISFDSNCRNIVLDGQGYKNIRKGLYIHRYSPKEFAETNVFLVKQHCGGRAV